MNSPQEDTTRFRHPPIHGFDKKTFSLMTGSSDLASLFQNTLMESFTESMILPEDRHESVLQITDDALDLMNPCRDFFDHQVVVTPTTMGTDDSEDFFEESSLSEDDLSPTPIDATRIQVVDSLPLKDSLMEQAPWSLIDDVRQLFLRQDEEISSPPESISFSTGFDTLQDTTIQRKRKMTEELHKAPMKQFDAQSHKDNKRQRVALVLDDDSAEEEEGHESRGSATSSSQPRHCSQWQDTYEELCKFQKVEGHCNVPPRYNNDPTLWRWIKRQRYQYKKRQGGRNPHAISDDRIAALERIGFVWDSQGTLWTERLKELEQFKNIHGHCSVPSKYPTNPQLSTWVKCQRRQYKLYFDVDDKKSNMTEERIEALGNLGFVFDPRGECKVVRQEKH